MKIKYADYRRRTLSKGNDKIDYLIGGIGRRSPIRPSVCNILEKKDNCHYNDFRKGEHYIFWVEYCNNLKEKDI